MHHSQPNLPLRMFILAALSLLLTSVVLAQGTPTPTPTGDGSFVEMTAEPQVEVTAETTEVPQVEATTEVLAEVTAVITPPVIAPTATLAPESTETPAAPIEPEQTEAAEATPEQTEAAEAAPSLSVSAECADQGVIFTVSNDGGAMDTSLEYALDGVVSGSLQLGAGESLSIDASYSQPVLQIGELIAAVDAPCLAAGTLSGQVWHDANLNHAPDAGEAGLANVTVRVTDSANTVIEAVTDTQGYYAFAALADGDYSVSVVPESLPASFAAIYDTDGTADGQTAVTIVRGSESHANFGYRELIPSVLGGVVWLDSNRNGGLDANEAGAGNVSISLRNAAGETVGSTATDSSGHFEFSGLFEGGYTVSAEAASLPYNTFIGTSPNIAFNAVMGQSRSDLSFGLQTASSSTISGFIQEQFASDTVFTVSLYNASGALIASAQTNSADGFSFGQLAAGQYTVRLNVEALPPNVYFPVNDSDGGTDASVIVTLDGANAANGIFFNLLISA